MSLQTLSITILNPPAPHPRNSAAESTHPPLWRSPSDCPTSMNHTILTPACSPSNETFTTAYLPCTIKGISTSFCSSSMYSMDSTITPAASSFPMDKTINSSMLASSSDLDLGACSTISLSSPTYTPPGTPPPPSYGSELSVAAILKSPPSSNNNQQPYSAKPLNKESSSKVPKISEYLKKMSEIY